MRVRQLDPDDVPECVALGVEAFRSVHVSLEQANGTDLFNRLTPDWEAVQAAQIESLCTSVDAHSFVAVEQDTIVGFVVALPNDATGLASIVTIAVHPNEQRRGVGTQLIVESLDEMRRLGMAYVQAYIRDFPGHHPARIAFGRAGFESMKVQPLPLIVKLTSNVVSGSRPSAIRRITESDIAECVRFGTESFRTVFGSFCRLHGQDLFDRMFPDWDHEQATYIGSACSDPDKETWVYEMDGQPCGLIVLTTNAQMLGEIELLVANADRAGHGIGSALNQFALDRLHEQGMVYAIAATADDSGHAAARRSYAKVGLVPMPVQWDAVVTEL